MRYFKNINNQECFQNMKDNNYFEGWYFKLLSENNEIISIIPGISQTKNDRHAFIQVINNINKKSYYFKYDINEFKYGENPFFVSISDNYFSLDKILLNIEQDGTKLEGEILINDITPIKKTLYSPNIMGPFAYIPFLECYHGVISLYHNIDGNISINNSNIDFNNGCGYIEKDYGTSFPSEYIWVHSNNVENKDTFFLSIANIPFMNFSFTGLLSILYIDNKEYRFSTYNFSKIKQIMKSNNKYHIEIQKGKYLLNLNITLNDYNPLYSPNNGNMIGTIKESLDSELEVELIEKSKVLYKKRFSPCLTEIEWNSYNNENHL